MYARHPENIGSENADRPSGDLRCTAVYRLRIGNYVAACSCGWFSPRRLLKAAACQDAWAHAAQSGCRLRVPLMHE
ncbi:MAG: hypothetical protein QOD36_1427 [Mycobacterium sp.]|jgi:hypothetical protein|nr:hypothetical protein [Mycobacterium sp.]MDT5244051.1 hypothetical protein [Mycobacterium sp.]MDT5333352.1 hypothetical protein [Mycobacterium sp.]